PRPGERHPRCLPPDHRAALARCPPPGVGGTVPVVADLLEQPPRPTGRDAARPAAGAHAALTRRFRGAGCTTHVGFRGRADSFSRCRAHAPVAILRSSTGTLRAAVESHVAVEALRRVHRAVGAGRDIRARSAVAHVGPGRYAPDYMMGSGPGSTWDGRVRPAHPRHRIRPP